MCHHVGWVSMRAWRSEGWRSEEAARRTIGQRRRRVGPGAAAGENSRGGAAVAKGGAVGGAGGRVAEGLERIPLAREMRRRRGR
jgi:hypothetical protein